MNIEMESTAADANEVVVVGGGASGLAYTCPRDGQALSMSPDAMRCRTCGTAYPIVRGIPVLIDDEQSVFRVADFTQGGGYEGASYGGESDRTSGARRAYRSVITRVTNLGTLSLGLQPEDAIARIRRERPGERILVIGAGDTSFLGDELVYTDVSFGAHTQCICDAHALPFPDGYFGGAVAVAVLEHVVDPWRCVEEMRRVLAPGGMVFASTPFLIPVHMGAHDFTRFTYLGHRRLFRWFEEVQGGPVLGPATSLALVLQHVLMCVSDRRGWRRVARAAGLVISAAVKQVDRLVAGKKGAYDSAAGFYFFGRKLERPIGDRELLRQYRGMQ